MVYINKTSPEYLRFANKTWGMIVTSESVSFVPDDYGDFVLDSRKSLL